MTLVYVPEVTVTIGCATGLGNSAPGRGCGTMRYVPGASRTVNAPCASVTTRATTGPPAAGSMRSSAPASGAELGMPSRATGDVGPTSAMPVMPELTCAAGVTGAPPAMVIVNVPTVCGNKDGGAL